MAKYCIHCYTPATNEETVCKACGKNLEPKKKNETSFAKKVLQTFFYNFWSILIFEFIFYLSGKYLLKPFTSFILSWSITNSGFQFIEGTNLMQALKNPLILVTAIFLIALNGFFICIELFALTYNAHESYHRRKIQPFSLVKVSFLKALKIFKPKNWIFFLFIIIIMPLLNVGYSNYLSSISVPGFIMQFIDASSVLSTVRYVLLALFILFFVLSIFYIQFFALSEDSFCTSIKKSFKLIKKRIFKTIGNSLWATFIMALIVFGFIIAVVLVIATLLLLCTSIVDLFKHFDVNQMTIFLPDAVNYFTGSLKRMVGFGALSTLTSILIRSMILLVSVYSICIQSSLFYRYQNEDDNHAYTKRIIPNTNKKFWTKSIKAGLCILIIFIIFASRIWMLNTSNDIVDINKMIVGPQICAHRGDSVSCPENSKAAILSAIEKKADYVEIDVAQTKDGVLVISHDNNIFRVTGKDINICDATWDEIKDLDTGSWFDPKFSDQRFLTLDEAMDLCDGKIKMNIELKPTGNEVNFEENCVRVFQEHHFYDKGFYASLKANTLLKIETLDPKIDTCLNSFVALGSLELMPVDIYSVEASFVTESLVNRINKANKKIWVWTVNNEDLVDEMIELDVDAIVTDDPVKTKQLTQDRKLTPEMIFVKILSYTFFTL